MTYYYTDQYYIRILMEATGPDPEIINRVQIITITRILTFTANSEGTIHCDY